MKPRIWIACTLVITCGALWAGRAMSDDKKPEEPKGGEMKMPSPEEMKKLMEEWVALAKPSDHHKALEPTVGSWETTMKMEMPGMPPMVTKGTAERKWVLGGRFIEERFSGEMMGPDPKSPMGFGKVKMEGIGLFGYDNHKNIYTGVWCADNGTQMLTMTGTMPPGSKTLTMYGLMDEPSMKMSDRYCKYVTKFVDADKFVFEVYDLAAGDNYKVFDITYSRKK